MAHDRTRIIVDGLVVQLLKNGTTTVYEYDTDLESLNAAKTLIDTTISELGE
tara:strand:- start:5540 stop:5695 length:156 start_codon:yes stop_codon:yes gene_type:complete